MVNSNDWHEDFEDETHPPEMNEVFVPEWDELDDVLPDVGEGFSDTDDWGDSF